MKLKYIIISVLALTLCVSCDSYLDKQPDDQLTIESVFENRTNMERWLAYIYTGIPKYYIYDGPDAIADELAPSVGWESQGFKAILYQNGNWTPSQPGVITYWQTLPKLIRQAYIFIENAHSLEDVSETEVNYMKAECRFMIAYYHSLLLMNYGSVPMIKGAAVGTNASDMMLKQEKFYEVVDWIAEELEETADQLPNYYDDATKYGRATALWCHAIRARLLTFAASPLVNGNPAMQNVVNIDNVNIFSSEFDAERWRVAADANKTLIDKAEEAGHALYIERADGDIDPFQSYQNAVMLRYNQGNTEIIIPRTYDDAGYFDRQANPRSMGGAGAIGITQNLVDAFFMKNGLVPITGYNADGSPIINPASGYTETGFSTTNEVAKTTWIYADKSTTTESKSDVNHVIVPSETFNMYCNREPRFYISVLYNEQYHYGKRQHGSQNWYTNFFSGGEDGGPSHDSPSAGYLIRKRVDPSAIPSDSKGTYIKRQGIVYRLAEAYLSYAECLLEYAIAKGTYAQAQSEILKYVNKIRERAGIPVYGSASEEIPVPTDPLVMRDLVHRERRVELNCEYGNRWYDLRRWNEAEKVLNGDFYGMNTLADKDHKSDFYKRTRYQTRKFISYWWPIPQDDIDKNTNLVQIPDWN